MAERTRRISNSFDHRELECFHQLCSVAMRGGDIRILLRSPEYAVLWGKMYRMLKLAAENIEKDVLAKRDKVVPPCT